MKKRIVWAILIIGLMLVSSGVSINALNVENKQVITNDNSNPQSMNNGIINITVEEAYAMCTNTGDGIQIPIDVRRIDEWRPQRIDTPIPEHPRWYLLDLIQNVSILPKFMFQYAGCDIILYCKGGYRSYMAAKIIRDDGNFTGTIYNMLGGITAWNTAGLPTAPGGIYNITVQQVWDLCTDTTNGIQNPIDVRRADEWYSGFIDTPWPESPIWICLDDLKNETKLPGIMADLIGQEVILYCKGGYRSLVGSYILQDNNFTGTQYNMLGGITDWINEGLPIRNNTAPSDPIIDGPDKVGVGVEHTWTFESTDAEGDGVEYWVIWGDGCPAVQWDGPFMCCIPINMTHTYTTKGKVTISAQARDTHGNESGWTNFTLRVPRARTSNFYLLEWILGRFPHALPVIRQLLGL